jgi:hypothetical protein
MPERGSIDGAERGGRGQQLRPTEQSGEGGAGLREDFRWRPLRAPTIGAGASARKRLHRRSRAGREGPACVHVGGLTEQSGEGGAGLREG